jgi:hypothetical protein
VEGSSEVIIIKESAMRALRISAVFTLAVLAASASAFEIEFAAGAGADTETPNPDYPWLDFIVDHQTGDLGFYWDLGLTFDGTYGGLFGGAYGTETMTVLIRQGGLTWRTGNLFASFGKLTIKDEIDSPYSLVLSSKERAELGALVRYEDEGFFFSDRWIALNYDSSNTVNYWNGSDYTAVAWPDRSAVIKCYGFKTGELRFGFQDISVFTDLYYGDEERGPLFDASYFLIPAPSFFIQYARMSIDAPWTTNDGLNDNSIMAFFVEWKRGRLGAQAQILVDDFNLNRFINPSSYQNPDKIAWAFGCSLESEIGTFRFDQAGATKYTFGPSGYGGIDNLMYGYTYYPDTEYELNGAQTAIDLDSSYVGYYHGENNIAFMFSWEKPRGGRWDAKAGLEFSMSGAKSPCNPWHQYTEWSEGGEGAQWLNDPVLEKKLLLYGKFEFPLGGFKLFASGNVGYVWNRLKLTRVYSTYSGHTTETDKEIPMYVPSSENAVIASITLGGSWTWRP